MWQGSAVPDSYLTLTAIHPTQKKRVPSHHIAIGDEVALARSLQQLHTANQMGWGAYFGVGYRKGNLGRWRRGGKADVLALPALFVDLDYPVAEALERLADMLPPTLTVASGRGCHAFWWLQHPMTDLVRAEGILRGLADWLDGDRSMSVDQVMRLPTSINTKPQRHHAPCRILDLNTHRYSLDDFHAFEPTSPPSTLSKSTPFSCRPKRRHRQKLNRALMSAITDHLIRDYGAELQENGWYRCHCLLHHNDDSRKDHASWSPERGLFRCFGKHGNRLAWQVAQVLHIDIDAYGGIWQ